MSYSNSSNAQGFYTTLKVKEGPLDTVHTIVNDPFRTNQHSFATGGWDGYIRYYQITQKNPQEIQLCYQKFLQHPVLGITIGTNNVLYAGLASGDIVAIDMANDQLCLIGTHEAPICQLFWIEKCGLLVSLGFDFKIKFWSMQNNNGNFLAKQFSLPFKTHTAAYDYPYLLIGTAENKAAILNLSNLANLNIPDQNGWCNVVQIGSKFSCSAIHAKAMLFTIGCVDGRCLICPFEDSYQGGIKFIDDPKRKIMSKSMKRESSYSHSPAYSQVNDIDIGIQGNQQYLVISGTEEISFFNVAKRDKPKRIKAKGTAGRLSFDGKYFIYAEGNDWCEGLGDWKKPVKASICVIKFTKSQLESLVRL